MTDQLVTHRRKYSLYDASVETWKSILTLAQKWKFKEVESLCVRELEKLPIPPVEKIHIYQVFKLEKSLLLQSYIELATRPEPLSLDDGHKLGIETSIQIVRIRELSRGSDPGKGPRKPSSVQLREAELRSVIQEAFALADTPAGKTDQRSPM
jgi:hypothetical protein